MAGVPPANPSAHTSSPQYYALGDKVDLSAFLIHPNPEGDESDTFSGLDVRVFSLKDMSTKFFILTIGGMIQVDDKFFGVTSVLMFSNSGDRYWTGKAQHTGIALISITPNSVKDERSQRDIMGRLRNGMDVVSDDSFFLTDRKERDAAADGHEDTEDKSESERIVLCAPRGYLTCARLQLDGELRTWRCYWDEDFDKKIDFMRTFGSWVWKGGQPVGMVVWVKKQEKYALLKKFEDINVLLSKEFDAGKVRGITPREDGAPLRRICYYGLGKNLEGRKSWASMLHAINDKSPDPGV